MKRIALVLLALLLPGLAQAQTAFDIFQPATGVLKGNASSYITTPATSADIISLWTGSCSSTTFLAGDGQCLSPGGAGIGTVTSVGLDVSALGFNTTSSPIVSAGTFTLGGTLNVAHGGTGATTLTGLLEGNGTSAIDPAEVADVISLWTGTCSSSTFLRGDGSCQSVPGTNDASTLTTGTLADARLSANVPLKNAANTMSAINTFTSTASNTGAVIVSATSPTYGWIDAAGATNEKRWRSFVAGGDYCLATLTDADGAGANALCATRTGTTVDTVAVTATALTHNGNAVLNTTSSLNGSNISSGTVADARLSANVALYNAANPTFSTVGNNALRAVNSTTGFARVGIETNGIFRGDFCSSTTVGQCATGDGGNELAIRFPAKLHLYDSAINQIVGTFQKDNGQLSLRSSSGLATTGTVNLELQASGGSAIGYFGDVSSVNSDIVVQSNVGNINLVPAGGSTAQVSGSQINTVATHGKIARGFVNGGTGALSAGFNVTATSRNSTGNYSMNLNAAGFTAQPVCTVTPTQPFLLAGVTTGTVAPFFAAVQTTSVSASPSNVDVSFYFICSGP